MTIALTDSVPTFALPGTDGRTHSLADYADVRHHVDVVAAAAPREEPATVLVLGPRTASA